MELRVNHRSSSGGIRGRVCSVGWLCLLLFLLLLFAQATFRQLVHAPCHMTRFSSAAITQSSSILPPTYPPCCIFIDDTSPSQPLDRTLRIHLRPRSHLSDLSDSSIDNSTHNIAPTPPKDIPPFSPDPPNTQPDACSALARHLLSHAKDLLFASKADVATWCCSNIKVDILWQSNTIGLISTAGTCSCHLCAAERMLIGQNLCSTCWRKGLLNLKSEMRGVCNCKTRFLRFSRSGQEGGL